MNQEILSKNPKKFLAMTGYTVQEFEALSLYFTVLFEEKMKTGTLSGKPRKKRKYTPYKKSPLPTAADNMLFILIYLKSGTIQEVHASLFGMHQSDANKRIHFLHPLLYAALKAAGESPARNADSSNIGSGGKFFLHDGTERPVVRPKNKEAQLLFYSGKKKQHSLKNILLMNELCRIIFLSDTCEGKKHDKKAADEAGYGEHFPEGSILLQDTGFQGFTAGNAAILQPKKKPKGGELTAEEKENNKAISKIRIRIEHVISSVKRYRILKDEIRNWKNGFRDEVMETCCGLHNFRLRFRPWTPVAVWN